MADKQRWDLLTTAHPIVSRMQWSCGLLLLCVHSLSSARLVNPDDIISVRTIQSVALSPDGKSVAYVATESISDPDSRLTIKSGMWLVPAAGVESRRCQPQPGEYSSPQWSPDGSALAFLSQEPGDEGAQIHLADSSCRNGRRLTRHGAPVAAFAWSPDGRRIAFLAQEPKNARQQQQEREGDDEMVLSISDFDRHAPRQKLWIVDPATGDERLVPTGPVHVSGIVWSPRGDRLLVTISENNDMDVAIRSQLAVVGLDGGTPLTYCPVEGKFTSPRWRPDGKAVLFLGASAAGREPVASSLYVCEGPNSRPMNLTEGMAFTMTSFQWLPGSTDLLTAILEKNTRYLAYFDPATRKLTRLSPAGEVVSNSFSLSANGMVVACSIEKPHAAAEVFAGPRTGMLAPLTHLNPQLDGIEWGETEDISWKAKDGLEITGILIKPVSYEPGHRYPLIVQPHGGPEGAEVNGFQIDGGQLLAAHGYAVLIPNFRGSAGRGVAYTLEDNRHFGDGDFQDIMAGVDDMIRRGIADPAQLGIGGWSYGGYLSAWAVTQTNRFKAAVMGYGVSSWFRLMGDTPQPLWTVQVHFETSPYDDPHAFLRNSPIEFAKQVRTPVLILHGTMDPWVSPSQSREFFRALKHFNVPTELVMYPREGHGFHEPMHRKRAMERVLAWYDRYVKNGDTR
jgi:dipeptidyl aminopeptidase/acylaminoacyl peptidase